MKGEFNYTLKKLIELSLTVGKAPVIIFKPLAEIIPAENEEVSVPETTTLNQVAEPSGKYKSMGNKRIRKLHNLFLIRQFLSYIIIFL
jgi:hypothetical protein